MVYSFVPVYLTPIHAVHRHGGTGTVGLVFGALEDGLLEGGGETVEVFAVAANADNEITVIFGMLHGIENVLAGNTTDLKLHTAALKENRNQGF